MISRMTFPRSSIVKRSSNRTKADDMIVLRVAYGLGLLDRFGLVGLTHFFQARIQLQIN